MAILRIFILITALSLLSAADSGVSVVHIKGVDYPFLAHLAAVEGTVEIVLLVGRDGAVRSTRVVSGSRLLADGAAKALESWIFSPCKKKKGVCEYPMSLRFVLQGEPINIAECKSEFQFDNPGRIVVTSQRARAIAD
jgi:hypothetical protein